MTEAEQREAARKFADKWRHGGDEKQDCHLFWLELLAMLGVEGTTEYIQFEKPVKLRESDGKLHTRYIDAYIPERHILIEQKGSSHKLDEKEHQSGGDNLTPFEQGKRYNDNLPFDERARWIVTCNFTDIWIYDMQHPTSEPQKLQTIELQTKYPFLNFFAQPEVKQLSHEMEISIKAGDIVGKLYDALIKQYKDPCAEHTLKSLNALCVRIVFCLYAEDANIFGKRSMFHDYLSQFDARGMRRALVSLFRVLDQKPEERDPYLSEDDPVLAAFPYVNGGLFRDETIEIPPITDEIRSIILVDASENFDWSDISPTIFGAVFESTLNPETRRSGGMHYTSIENIHKVIDPLFLDDLKAEFAEIKKEEIWKNKKKKLEAFQKKLASLRWLDPACGSGNFLTETYLSIRRLENDVISELQRGQISFAVGTMTNPIQVSITQFYGIEINDFAVTVAKTALWIAESQMMKETEDIIKTDLDFLPLTTNANIVEANALRIDWNDVIDKSKLNYIMGNPPFVGSRYQLPNQKSDVNSTCIRMNGDAVKGASLLDYVSCWYYKTASYIQNSNIECAFVSTNSITQGEQVALLWDVLSNEYKVKINFAYRTFIWDSEASEKAHVHCVIIGFSLNDRLVSTIYYADGSQEQVNHINGYLLNAPDIYMQRLTKPLCDVPRITNGNRAYDGNNLVMTCSEKDELIAGEPRAQKYIKKYFMGADLLKNEPRYVLWLVGCSPSEIRSMPMVLQRVEAVYKMRISSKNVSTKKAADTPMLFQMIVQPKHKYIAFARVSSQRRRYIPIAFLNADDICGDKLIIIPEGELYHFGILMSNVHNAWMRVVAGRLKSDYSYSSGVYNNFPWPSPTPEQKPLIEQTAQAILDARALYPDSSLADLYDPLTMPPELRKAHTANDIAVMKAYGFSTKMSEADCVAELMKMYQKLVNTEGKG